MEIKTKQIYKNTFFLYLRQFIVLIVALFTTRIVLKVLGEENYGIYNVVAGVVIMLNIVTSTMSSATQRYLSIGVGRGDKKTLQEIFNTSMCIYIVFAIICVILGETLGLWFLKSKLSIPDGRMQAAVIVFHLAIFSFVMEVLRTPYNATIIAYEKMNVYAYFSIFSAVMQLIMVLFISVIKKYDSLIVYSGFMAFSAVLTSLLYVGYCKRKLMISAVPLTFSKYYFKEIFSFSFWSLFGSLATLGVRQTMNIFLNMFFGVKINASSSIATKLSTTTYTLVSSFTTAYTPQIYKQYASGKYDTLNSLINRATSISFYLYIILMVPVFLVMDKFLAVWLVDVPQFSALFCRLLLLYLLLDAHQYPLVRLVTAIGNIRNYQVVFSIINLMNLPIMWLLFHFGYPPFSIYVVFVLITFITSIYRVLYIRRKYAYFNLRYYLLCSLRLLFVLVLSFVVSYTILSLISINKPIVELGIYGIISLLITAAFIWFLGCNKQERAVLLNYIKIRLKIK
jgi:O-antigen/teichoic acid export membrane protein